MDLKEYKKHVEQGKKLVGGSAEHLFMHEMSQEASKLCHELNDTHHTPEEI